MFTDKALEILMQLPVAGLMMIVVWKFLQFIKERDQSWLDTVRNRDMQFLEQLEKQHEHQKEHADETVRVLRENASVVRRAAELIEKVDKKLDHDQAGYATCRQCERLANELKRGS